MATNFGQLADIPWIKDGPPVPPVDMLSNLRVAEIFTTLHLRYKFLNFPLHYEAGWTDSWSHRRCLHHHPTLIEAAQYARPHGAGWYVFAVQNGSGRELNKAEECIVNDFRFGEGWSAKLLDIFSTTCHR